MQSLELWYDTMIGDVGSLKIAELKTGSGTKPADGVECEHSFSRSRVTV